MPKTQRTVLPTPLQCTEDFFASHPPKISAKSFLPTEHQEKQHQDIWWGAQHLAAPQSPGCSSAPSALITLSAPRAQATRISKPASQGEQGGKERNRNTSWLIDTKDIKTQRKVTERALLLDPGAVHKPFRLLFYFITMTASTPKHLQSTTGIT